MSRVYIEQRTLANARMNVIAADLVYHFYARLPEGKIVVIAKEPFLLLRVVRKHWLRLEKTVHRERAKTLDSGRIAELSKRLTTMRNLTFTAKLPSEAPMSTIYFLSELQISAITSELHTAYVAHSLKEADFTMLCNKLELGSLVVSYAEHLTE